MRARQPLCMPHHNDKWGASVNARRHLKSKDFLSRSTYPSGFACALTATAALLIGTPANALTFGLFGQPTTVAPHANTRAPAHHVPKVASRTHHNADSKPAEGLASKVKGPLEVIISLDRQHLTLYSGNEVIGQTRVSTGRKGRATPTGVFSVIQRDRWHRSNLYDDAPMYFMQRITWSGVAMHEGYVPNYPASHGCIRLPSAFARQLWALRSMGARVIISHGEVAPTEISHPALFVPKAPPAVATISQSQSLQAAEQAWQLALLDGKNDNAMPVTDFPAVELPPLPAVRPLKPGPVSVFISRKKGKLYVRKGLEPMLEVPVTIDQPDQPLGTHVFTAISVKGDTARWNVVTLTPKTSAAAALDRITIPQDVRDRIDTLMADGASLIISDKAMSGETGKGTDFIVTGL
jgi:lipoprotein-anchoring transpeptidase ErfK/SrfK